MSADTDTFEQAMALDGVLNAYERRAAGSLVHPTVDARVLTTIAQVFNFRLTSIGAYLTLYVRVCALAERIEALGLSQREDLASALESDRRTAPWRPMRGAQSQGFEIAGAVDELLLAGGAGSSKTDLAIGIALWQSRAARFVRKTSLEFAAILKRLGEILGTTDGRNLASQNWALSSPFGFEHKGVTLEFNSLAEPDSMLRLQGRPVDCLVVDDAGSGQIPQADIEFVSRWLRSVEMVRKRLVFTSNPPSSTESLWLRDDVFAPWLSPSYAGVPAQSGEIRYFLPGDGASVEVPPGTPGAISRSVVMSTVQDNPRLVHTGYAQHLQQSPTDVLRRRLLENDWTAGWDTDDAMQVIPSDWIDQAMARWTPTPKHAMSAVGIDVARGGKDRTTIARRHRDWFNSPLIYPGKSTPDGQAVAVLVLAARGPSSIAFIDSTGVGASPYDLLRERIVIVPIVFGAGCDAYDVTRSFSFFNLRSMLWWRMREALDPNGRRRLALPPDRTLKAELCMPRYELRSGRLFVEDRDSIIKRLKRSPDVATAFVLALIDADSTLAYVDDFHFALHKSNAEWRKRNPLPHGA